MRAILALGLLGVTLAGCGPMSPDLAADRCEERARLAVHPRGHVYVGARTGVSHPVVGGQVTFSSDMFSGRDPYELYDTCVRQLSGQGPIRPLDLGS